MTTVLQKARWPIFGVGMLLIAIGGFGFLTGASWASYFGSVSTIFGTMMSFAQMFVAFPTTTIHLPHADTNGPAPAPPRATPGKQSTYSPPRQQQPNVSPYPNYQQPVPWQQHPIAPPPPAGSYYAPYPAPTQDMPKRYKWSGIALWIGAACALLQIYSLSTLYSGHYTLQDIYDYYSVIFLQGVCFLLALRGIHAKHARTAGALGIVAILVIGGALILSIIASGIYVGSANSATYVIAPSSLQQVGLFSNIDDVFIVVGDILLGVSLIYGKVYPTWIGIVGIALGCVAFFEALSQFGNTPAPLGLMVVGLLLSFTQNAATGWVLFKKPQAALAYPYR
jgi:hypothetical protein